MYIYTHTVTHTHTHTHTHTNTHTHAHKNPREQLERIDYPDGVEDKITREENEVFGLLSAWFADGKAGKRCAPATALAGGHQREAGNATLLLGEGGRESHARGGYVSGNDDWESVLGRLRRLVAAISYFKDRSDFLKARAARRRTKGGGETGEKLSQADGDAWLAAVAQREGQDAEAAREAQRYF